jgi:hypothetical protein
LVLLGRQKDRENVTFLGKAGSMGTLIGLILLICLIFVQPLETAKCKMMNAKCKSGRCAWGLVVVVVCGALLLACFVW